MGRAGLRHTDPLILPIPGCGHAIEGSVHQTNLAQQRPAQFRVLVASPLNGFWFSDVQVDGAIVEHGAQLKFAAECLDIASER